MLTSRILLVVAIVAGAGAWIPYENVNFVLLDGFSQHIHSQINESVHQTMAFFERRKTEASMINDQNRVSFKPYIKPISSTLPIIRTVLTAALDWHQFLSKLIPDTTQRNIVDKELNVMLQALNTIIDTTGVFESDKTMSIATKSALVHNIHDNLDIFVYKFSNRQSIFRKYPLIAMPMLLSLAPFVSLFVYAEGAIVPESDRGSLISCRLYKALYEYRSLAVESRLMKLDIVDSMGTPINKRQPINTVLAKVFNENGYNISSDPSISCRKGCHAFVGAYVYVCLRDPISRTEYDCHMRHEMYACLFGYMEYTRFRIEHAFNDPMKLVAKTCTDEARNQPLRPAPTGFGWLTIMFHGAEAHTDLAGSSCDDWGACDAYLKMFLDGKEVYRTDSRSNTHMPYFGEVYRSNKIHKSAHITLELWDEDNSWIGSSDTLMLRWETTIDALLSNGIKWGEKGYWKNKIITASSWKDEYPDSILQLMM